MSSACSKRSRVTLAMMDAAAIERHFASPLMIVCVRMESGGARLPSIKAKVGIDCECCNGLAHGAISGLQNVDVVYDCSTR